MLAHLPLAERLAIAEVIGELVVQRRAAEEHAGRVQIQADEWERSARLCEQEATGWRSKHQAIRERVGQVAAELEQEARELPQAEGEYVTVTRDWLVGLAGRLLTGDSLPGDGEVVRTEETVPVGGEKL